MNTLGFALSELRNQTENFQSRCRVAGWFGALFHVGIQRQILADVAHAQTRLASVAHKSETYDREALRLMDEAQAPDSDGGEDITPAEARRIRTLTAKSAELDHDAAEMATV